MNIENHEVSPFNAKESIKASYLTLEETGQLWHEFSSHYHVIITEEVSLAVYEYTLGYPGLWNLCARAIQNEVIQSDLKTFGLLEWQTLLNSGKILVALFNFPASARIISEFTRDPKLASEAKLVFLQHLFSGKEQITLDPTNNITIFLANLGLFIPYDLETNTFNVGARILQDCFSVHVLKHFSQKPLSVLPPLDSNGKVDVLQTLVSAISCFNCNSLSFALQYSFKTAEINDKAKVLKEAAYSFELVSILRAWFPLDYHIVPEVNCSKDKADIFIRYGEDLIVLELLSNERYGPETRLSSVLGHIKRTVKYGTDLQAQEAWIVHFISVAEFPTKTEAIVLPSKPMCSCAYIYHLHDFSSFQIVSKKKDTSLVVTTQVLMATN